jgi:predicted phage terminase large subunit-like protein
LIRGAWLPDGTLYAPTILPQATLDKLRYDSDLTEKEFAVWYLNEPMEEGSKVFPRSIIRFFKGKYVFDREPFLLIETSLGSITVPVFVTMAIDPAFSTAVAADFTGFTVVGTGPDGTMYVLCADAFKGSPDAVVDHAIAIALKFKPRILSIEAVAAQVLFKPLLVPRLRESGLGATQLYEYKQSMRRSKGQRIEAMQPRFKQNLIQLSEGLGDLAEQLNRYPELDHDDLIDSLAQHMELSRPPRHGEVHPAVGRDWFEEVRQWSLETDGGGSGKASHPNSGAYGGRHSSNMPGLTSERPPNYS